MQKKINLIIWITIPILIIFFLIIGLIKGNEIKKYTYLYSEGYDINVSVYTKSKDVSIIIDRSIKELDYKNEEEYINNIINIFKSNNVDTYTISNNNLIIVDEYYLEDELYDVALLTNSNNVYEIIKTKNETIKFYDSDNENYNRIIIIDESIEKVNSTISLLSNLSIEEIEELNIDSEIIVLNNEELVYTNK